MSEEINIPNDVKVAIDNDIITINGKCGENKKRLFGKNVKIELRNDKIAVFSKKSSQREKKIIGSFKAHIKNLIKSAREGSTYSLKICSGHFPMNVSIEKDNLVIKNFLGEKIPRRLKLRKGVDVKIDGDTITVTSCDKENAGQTAASIEQLTRRTNYDHRVFQDGIWITNKDGKEMK